MWTTGLRQAQLGRGIFGCAYLLVWQTERDSGEGFSFQRSWVLHILVEKKDRELERYKSELVTFYYCKIECECANTTDIDFSLDYSETPLPVCRFGRTMYIVSYFSLDFIVSVIVVLIEIRTEFQNLPSSNLLDPLSWLSLALSEMVEEVVEGGDESSRVSSVEAVAFL